MVLVGSHTSAVLALTYQIGDYIRSRWTTFFNIGGTWRIVYWRTVEISHAYLIRAIEAGTLQTFVRQEHSWNLYSNPVLLNHSTLKQWEDCEPKSANFVCWPSRVPSRPQLKSPDKYKTLQRLLTNPRTFESRLFRRSLHEWTKVVLKGIQCQIYYVADVLNRPTQLFATTRARTRRRARQGTEINHTY